MNARAGSAVRTFGAKAAMYLLLAAGSMGIAVAGDSMVGKVVAVKSGNLVTLDWGGGTRDVRINGIEIDTGKAAALAARTALSNLILGKTVRLRFDGLTPEGQLSGRIWLGGIDKPEETIKDVGVELVRAGSVRADKEYRHYKYGELEQAEAEARQFRRGLWR